MDMNIKTNKKYLLLIPLAVSLIMLTFFSAAFDDIVRQKHEQKYNTVRNSLNFIVSVVDRIVEAGEDWNEYDYAALLMPVFSQIDEISSAHVVLLDHTLVPISGNFVYDIDTSFDLLSCDEFMNAVKENDDSGELTVMITDSMKRSHEMKIYFKKIPTGQYDNKLTAVYGVSRYSVDDNFAPWLVWGVIGMISMTVLLQIWMILYISKLSDAERLARRNNQKVGEKT